MRRRRLNSREWRGLTHTNQANLQRDGLRLSISRGLSPFLAADVAHGRIRPANPRSACSSHYAALVTSLYMMRRRRKERGLRGCMYVSVCVLLMTRIQHDDGPSVFTPTLSTHSADEEARRSQMGGCILVCDVTSLLITHGHDNCPFVAGLSREIPGYIPPGGVKVHRQRSTSPPQFRPNIWHLGKSRD